MQLKLKKKDNKFYRISFATLSITNDKLKEGLSVQSKETNEIGTISRLDKDYIYINWNDSIERIRRSYANKELILRTDIPEQKLVQSEQLIKKIVSSSVPTDRIGTIVNMAIQKHLIDADEAVIKRTELESLDETELTKYEQEVNNAIADEIEDANPNKIKIDPEMTDAEKMLAKIRGNGGKATMASDAFLQSNLNSNGSGTRDLKSIQSDRKLDIDMTKFNPAGIELSSYMESLNNHLTKTAVNNARQYDEPKYIKKNSMDNLKGLTKPIVQQSTPISVNKQYNDLLAALDWTTTASQR